MSFWMVRAGKYGEHEDLALEKGLAVIGWEDMPDLSQVNSFDEMKSLTANIYNSMSRKWISHTAGQLWSFKHKISLDDFIILPLKSRSALAIGQVKGPYEYKTNLLEDIHHSRPVEWKRLDVPRTDVGQDLLFSLGAFMTVCQISRNNADARFRALLVGKPDPYLKGIIPDIIADDGNIIENEYVDIAQISQNQIIAVISAKFQGHNLTRLVEAVLNAQGYQTYRSPEGPDGGMDLLAGSGPMGFDTPRLCVQVKSLSVPVDVSAVRELEGVMSRVNADRGLFVSWKGFTSSVYREMRHLFFKVRLWDSANLVQVLLANYDKLPDEIQTEIPLKRTWTLVLDNQMDTLT